MRTDRPRRSRMLVLLGVVACVTGCRADEMPAYRGAGLEVARLPLNDAVAVYRAALGGSFTMGDPSLSILVDSLLLPREPGLQGGTPVSPELRAALKAAGISRGTCSIPVTRTRQPLICEAERAGYAVRLSDLFALGRDSIQVSVVVEQYAIPNGPRAERLRFERAYHVARRGRNWRAVREARMPQP
jgi:hypothetical protein